MMKILLVKEAHYHQGSLQQTLSAWGYDVTSCDNADAALTYSQQTRYPLILLDLADSSLNGARLCRQIRAHPQNSETYILVLDTPEQRQRLDTAILEGADAYLLSPIKTDALHKQLQSITRRIQRLQTEQTLWENETRYRELADSITDIFFALDKRLQFTYWNKASENLTGISAENALGRSLYDIFPSMKGTEIQAAYFKILETKQPHTFIQSHEVKGQPAFFEINVYPSRDGFSVFAKNVTYRKQMEEALKKSWDYLENLNNSLGDAIFTVKMPHPIVEYVNRAIENIFGYTPDECIGRHTRKLFLNRRSYLEFSQKLQKAIQAEADILRTEHQLKRKNGEPFTAEITTTFLNETGNLTGIISIVRDITDRKQIEVALEQERASLAKKVEERTAELQRINMELERASRLKDEFLANISHDLRTPLNAILGYAKILIDAGKLSPLQQEGLVTIKSSGEHLLNLINDILDLSKIEAGRVELRPNEFHLPEFLQQIANIILIRAEQKGITFTYITDPRLPGGVYADEKRLREILFNLLDNAVKFTQHGHVTLKIQAIEPPTDRPDSSQPSQALSAPSPEEQSTCSAVMHLRFQIEDTGAGIAPEQLEEIFLPFHQVNEHQSGEGTGLGLAISQQFVKIMGGELHVRSTLGQGSTFWFELALPAIPSLIPLRPVSVPEILGYQGHSRKILIADDKKENRALLAQMLTPLGFQILEAGDGQICMTMALEHQPDAILLDLRMPVMDGFKTTQCIRETPALRDTVVIAISASAFEDTRKKSLTVGSDAFLPKPINKDHLLECLQAHLHIEWEYADQAAAPNQDPSSTTAAVSVTLDPDIRDNLRAVIVQGNMTRLFQQLDRLEQAGQDVLPLVATLRDLARSFQFKKMLAALEQAEKPHANN